MLIILILYEHGGPVEAVRLAAVAPLEHALRGLQQQVAHLYPLMSLRGVHRFRSFRLPDLLGSAPGTGAECDPRALHQARHVAARLVRAAGLGQ